MITTGLLPRLQALSLDLFEGFVSLLHFLDLVIAVDHSVLPWWNDGLGMMLDDRIAAFPGIIGAIGADLGHLAIDLKQQGGQDFTVGSTGIAQNSGDDFPALSVDGQRPGKHPELVQLIRRMWTLNPTCGSP